MSIYTDNGYANRKEYLDELREEYGNLVNILIRVLPRSEDFDGLVTALEDAMESGEYDDLIWYRGKSLPLYVLPGKSYSCGDII